MPNAEILNTVMQIAREAGQISLEYYSQDLTVEWKGAGQTDPVTAADRRVNQWIVERLSAAFPADGIVAEESETSAAALDRARIWYVDPLDGTKEFIAKNGEFSVMIGLAVDGRAYLGVVFAPCTGKLYAGVVDEGAWLVSQDGARQALHVRKLAQTADLTLIVSRSHRPAATEQLKQRLGIQRECISGSVGLKCGQIAEQNADLYVHMSDRSSAWDACAPEAILVAAGGRFTDLAGQPIRYGSADVRMRRGLLACNAAAFEAVLPTVRELSAQRGLLETVHQP